MDPAAWTVIGTLSVTVVGLVLKARYDRQSEGRAQKVQVSAAEINAKADITETVIQAWREYGEAQNEQMRAQNQEIRDLAVRQRNTEVELQEAKVALHDCEQSHAATKYRLTQLELAMADAALLPPKVVNPDGTA